MVQHIKRQMAPGTWPLVRKGKERWVVAPNPAGYPLRLGMPVLIALRDALCLAETKREAKQILHNNTVLLNNRKVMDLRRAVGLFDVLTVKELGKSYRLVLTPKNKLAFVEVKKTEADILPLKVKGVTLIKGGRWQVNFANGWNLLEKSRLDVGSTVLYNTKNSKVVDKIELKKGAKVALTGGKHVGKLATFEKIDVSGKLRKTKLAVLKPETKGDVWRTRLEQVFVVGANKPAFTAVKKDG